MREVVSQDYFGFGDNIYKRPFIKQLAKDYDKVYLYTAFPELFSDIPKVVFCKPFTHLKTQAVNIDYHKQKGTYFKGDPSCTNKIKLNYGKNLSKGKTVFQSFEEHISIEDPSLDLPIIDRGKERAIEIYNSIPKDKKVCIVRYPSIRREWACHSRNAKTEYFNLLVEKYKDEYYYLSIGDIDDNESFVGRPNLDIIDYKYHNKELDLFETLNLMLLVDMTISIPCFVLPLAIAIKIPAFFIYGGYVKHELLTDHRMDLSKIDYVAPTPFCNCVRNDHICKKDIDTNIILSKFQAFKERIENGKPN